MDQKLRCLAFALALLTSGPVAAEGVDDLGWMAGSWVREEGGSRQEEHWMSPAGGTMLGMGRSVRPGKPAEFEHLRIGNVDGTLSYWALPGGQQSAAFALVESGPNRAVFANPAHDFPQKIIYERVGDTLNAAIEGPGKDGTPKTIRWTWTRSGSVDGR